MQLQDVLNYCSSHGHVSYNEAIRFSGSKESIAVYASLDRLVILTEHSNGDVENQTFKDTELKRSIDSALSRRLAMDIRARAHNVSECPWCGHKPSTTSIIRGKDDRITEGYIIACSIRSCKAKPALDNQCSTVEEAISKWEEWTSKWKAMEPEKQQASREYCLAAYNKRKAEKEAKKEAASKATAKAMAESVYS